MLYGFRIVDERSVITDSLLWDREADRDVAAKESLLYWAQVHYVKVELYRENENAPLDGGEEVRNG